LKTISLPVLNSPLVENQKGNKTTEITGYSVFNDIEYSIEDYNGLFITDRIEAQNFRHRMSEPGYFSTWHVAGDATLIIVRSGTLRMTLRNGDYRDFSAGDMFVAQDYLQNNETFNNEVHGHTAELIGDEPLFAVHIKLATRVV
jgi:hypothetical protein